MSSSSHLSWHSPSAHPLSLHSRSSPKSLHVRAREERMWNLSSRGIMLQCCLTQGWRHFQLGRDYWKEKEREREVSAEKTTSSWPTILIGLYWLSDQPTQHSHDITPSRPGQLALPQPNKMVVQKKKKKAVEVLMAAGKITEQGKAI